MKLKHIIINCITAASFCAFPISSLAIGFYISNDTIYPASFKVNNGDCSTKTVGMAGLVEKNKLAGTNDTITAALCGDKKTNCVFEIHMTKDCSGPAVAVVTFDLNKGIVTLDDKKVSGYFIKEQSDRTVYIAGGPVQ